MRIRTIKYFLSESIRSMVRNRLMTIASIITVASCTLILAISYFLITNINQILEGLERSMSIVVFVDDYATENELQTLEEQLLQLPYINPESLSFTSSEEAFYYFMRDIGFDEATLEGLPQDTILPSSFSLELYNIENQQIIVGYIENLDNVLDIRYDQDAINVFITFSRSVSIIGLVMILFLASISTVIIINTIKITVSARKNEINIMKYVGATDSFIRWPFLMEGILIGIVGATVALGSGYFIYAYVVNSLVSDDGRISLMLAMFLFVPRDITDVFIFLVPVCLGLGTIIGVIGSATSIRKYLRV